MDTDLAAPAAAAAEVQPAEAAHTMQCMEVWGGNEAADEAVRMPGLDVWVYSRPYQGDASGGDVHYVSRCGTGRIARLLVADVSGHGREVSEIAVSLRNLMRKFVNFLDQTRFVESLNREFAGQATAGNFATAVVGTYWAPTRYLVTCNAGHPRPFHYRAATGKWELLAEASEIENHGPENLPLGILDTGRYRPHGVRLERGDLVLIYTDSLVEARADGGALLGEAGVLSILNTLDASRPHGLTPALLSRAQAYARAEGLGDDATVMLLRCTAEGAARMGVRETVNAIWLFFGLVIGRLAGGSTPIPWPELRLENIGGAVLPRLNLRWGAAKAS